MLDNPIIMKDADHLAVWMYLLLNATHAEYPALFKGQKIMLQPGQLITGRKSISEKLSINESKVRRVLDCFENDQQIDRQRSNKNSLISLNNWDKYQCYDQQNGQQPTNNRPTTDQQPTTNKNVKNDNNVKNERINYQQIADMFNETCVSFSKVKSLSESRKKAIKARLNTYSVDDFKTCFEKAESSDFLKGKNDRNWTASFDWLIKDSNMAKVLDGNYDNKPRQSSGRKEAVPGWMNKPNNKFNNFDQRDYSNMDDLEKKLLTKTAATDEDVRARAEKLKQELGGV